jgi:hypothetical protein
MPLLDASDKIRRIQQTALFEGYAIGKQTSQPGVNVSTCTTFYSQSTIRKYNDYTYKNQIQEGLIYFSTCQGNFNSHTGSYTGQGIN